MNVDKKKTPLRAKADKIKPYQCKNLIAVIENPNLIMNIATVIRNVNALGVEKVYIVDKKGELPDNWEEMREDKKLNRTSVSAIKWSFVKRFNSTVECLSHLESNGFVSIATSPHIKGKENYQLDEVDYTKHPKLAVWFGNEKHGVSQELVSRCEYCISIPMFGIIESLNLATSSGIALYEITKQRRKYIIAKKECK